MNYTEIFRLKTMLEESKIPFCYKDRSFNDFIHHQIEVPKHGEGRIIGIIQGDGSYGGEQNLLEIMGLLTDKESENDSVCGGLTAENVFDRIKAAIT